MILPNIGDNLGVTAKHSLLLRRTHPAPEVVANDAVKFHRVRRFTCANQTMQPELVVEALQK